LFSFCLFATKCPSLLDDWIEGKLMSPKSTVAKYKNTDSSQFGSRYSPIPALRNALARQQPDMPKVVPRSHPSGAADPIHL
jgi:hypothetical protein